MRVNRVNDLVWHCGSRARPVRSGIRRGQEQSALFMAGSASPDPAIANSLITNNSLINNNVINKLPIPYCPYRLRWWLRSAAFPSLQVAGRGVPASPVQAFGSAARLIRNRSGSAGRAGGGLRRATPCEPAAMDDARRRPALSPGRDCGSGVTARPGSCLPVQASGSWGVTNRGGRALCKKGDPRPVPGKSRSAPRSRGFSCQDAPRTVAPDDAGGQ